MQHALAWFLFGFSSLAGAGEGDAWSERVTWRAYDGFYASGVHATLMPDGRILFIGFERDTEDPLAATQIRRSAWIQTPSPAGSVLPAEIVIENLTQPVEYDFTFVGYTGRCALGPGKFTCLTFGSDDLFCSGQTLTADGDYFSVGGTRALYHLSSGETDVIGIPYATRFDGTDWTRLTAEMTSIGSSGQTGRWYPSVMRLHDGRLLVMSGYDVVLPVPALNISVELYDPGADAWTELSPHGASPFEIFNPDYTHPMLLPEPVGAYDVVMFGQDGLPVLFDVDATPHWFLSSQERPESGLPDATPNVGASTVMLPIRVADGEWGYSNGSVLLAGGTHLSTHQESIDVYDTVQDAWLPRRSMGVPRHHPSTTILPDGRILVVAGHSLAGEPELRQATYVDPAEGFTVSLGEAVSGEVRGYHTTALLLPDGRVLVGGGRDLDTLLSGEKSHFRYLSPDYVFEQRPSILSAPDTLRFDRAFTLVTGGRRPVEFALVSLGSMTHSMDFNQRYVELKPDKLRVATPAEGPHAVRVRAPRDGRVAPPGYYMLFVLDAARTPSEAKIVRLE